MERLPGKQTSLSSYHRGTNHENDCQNPKLASRCNCLRHWTAVYLVQELQCKQNSVDDFIHLISFPLTDLYAYSPSVGLVWCNTLRRLLCVYVLVQKSVSQNKVMQANKTKNWNSTWQTKHGKGIRPCSWSFPFEQGEPTVALPRE